MFEHWLLGLWHECWFGAGSCLLYDDAPRALFGHQIGASLAAIFAELESNGAKIGVSLAEMEANITKAF